MYYPHAHVMLTCRPGHEGSAEPEHSPPRPEAGKHSDQETSSYWQDDGRCVCQVSFLLFLFPYMEVLLLVLIPYMECEVPALVPNCKSAYGVAGGT